MKNTILIILFLVLALGCSTVQVSKDGKSEDDAPNTLDIVDLSSAEDMWWLISQQDPSGFPVQLWVTNDKIYFLNNGGIYFVDENNKGIILYNNFSFTLIKIGEWSHPDFDMRDFNRLKESLRSEDEPQERPSPKPQIEV